MKNKKIDQLNEILTSIPEAHGNLKKEGATSLCGPCPKCGGDDRFVYKTDSQRFWCRHCYPEDKPGDKISYHMWIEGLDFKGLVEKYLPKLEPFEHYQLGFPVEKYAYTNEASKVRYYNCRFEPKEFRQCSADGLSWKTKNIKPKVPYQLNKVRGAKTIFIVEGEKDCHSLAKLNLVGTCNVGGAGSWTSDLNKHFKGKEIILLPDNDKPGKLHAQKVYSHLNGIAEGIKLIELPGLPPGGDVTDWINTFPHAEEAAERLSILIDQAGPYEPPKIQEESGFIFIHNADVLANLKPIEWQVKDILVENSLYYDFGDPESFKTFVALDRLLCVAAGIDYHGHRVKQGTVFYIAGEGQQGLGRRIAAWHAYHKTNAKDIPFFMAKTPTQLMDTGALDDVRRAVDTLSKEYGNPAILHLDTLARNFGEGDENATKDMNRVIKNMDTAFRNDFCRGITHHTGHTNKDRARGSIALHAAADTAYRISVAEGRQILGECKKMKDACSALPMLFDLETVLLQIDNDHDQSYILTLAAEGDDAAAAKTLSNTYKVSEPMRKAVDLLDNLYVEYEANLAADGRKGDIPRVSVSDWRETCIEKKLYKRKGNFDRALERMQDRKMIHLDENGIYAYSMNIYLKYLLKEDD